jgi:hypothetical protein
MPCTTASNYASLVLVDTVDRYAGTWQSAAIGAFSWILKLHGTLDVRACVVSPLDWRDDPVGASVFPFLLEFSGT